MKTSKLRAIIVLVLLLVAIPVGIFLVRQTQELREKAASPEVTAASVEWLGNGRVRVAATGNSETTGITAYLVRDGELEPISGLNAGNNWTDEGPVNNVTPNNYRVRFIPNQNDEITGTPIERELIVPGQGAPAPGGTSGPPEITGTVSVFPSPLAFTPNKESRIGITVPAQNANTDTVTAWLFGAGSPISLTIARADNGWTNTDIWPGNIPAGNYTLKVIPSKAGTQGTSQDFPVQVKADAPTTPQIIGSVDASPTTFEKGSTRRISLHAVGDGNTTEVVAWLYKLGVDGAIRAIGSTTSPQWRNDDPGPQTYSFVDAGNYILRFIPTRGSIQGPPAPDIEIKITAAGDTTAPTTTSDSGCTSIELARGGSDINPGTVRIGDSLSATIFCYTTDSSDDIDMIRYTLTTPTRSAVTQELTALREVSRDNGGKRFFIAKFNISADSSGNYNIKGWGHTPRNGWRGK